MKYVTGILTVLLILCPLSLKTIAQNEVDGAIFSFGLYDKPRAEMRTRDEQVDTEKVSFRVGEEVYIRPLLTNNSFEPLDWTITDPNFLFIFDLRKEGESLPVSYRADKAALLSIREEEMGAGGKLSPDPIPPWEIQGFEEMKLSDRFETLSAGKYKLLIHYKVNRPKKTKGGYERVRLRYTCEFEVWNVEARFLRPR